MISLEETLHSQRDLVSLCADRPAPSREPFVANDYYGHAFILKTYARLPRSYRLKVLLQHGVYLDDALWDLERSAPLPAFMGWQESVLQKCSEETNKTVLSNASPFLYVLKMMKPNKNHRRKGTLFFPAHSSHHVRVRMDYRALARTLHKLEERWQPVTVCMYWRDVVLGHHIEFVKAGLPVVSAGHIYDPFFLFRLYHLCSIHEFSSSNVLGTHTFYSIQSGCFYVHVPSVDYRSDCDAPFHSDIGVLSDINRKKLDVLMSPPGTTCIKEQANLAEWYTGAAFLKSPQALRADFLRAELLDKARCFIERPRGLQPVIPCYCWRMLWRGYRYWKQVRGRGARGVSPEGSNPSGFWVVPWMRKAMERIIP